jgi:hypothetical protein
MRCLKSIFLILILLASLTFGVDNEKLRWVEISTDLNEELFFVSGSSKNNFWVQTRAGILLNIIDGKINTYSPSPKNSLMKTEYFQISENDFLCAATTSNWKGEIYRVKNNIWKKYNFENPYPLISIYKTSDNNFYIIGDFGTLLKFSNNDWEIIATPFDSHIISAIVDENNLYFATRNDGIILFDGNKFKRLTSPGNNDYIILLKIINNTLYGFSSNNKLFSYENNIEKRSNNSEIIEFFVTNNNSSNFGFSDYSFYNKNKNKKWLL